MSKVKEIIILDDDEEEEEPPRPTKATASPCISSKETNGKEDESGSSSQSKAEMISAQNKTLFIEFIEYCSNLTSDHPEVISFLQGRYAKANPSYLGSVEFRNTLGRCLTRVQSKRSKIFVYINELCTALKANSQKRKVSLQTQAILRDAAVQAETPAQNEEEAESVPEKKTGSKRQIRYLENLLRIYSLEIKKLQEKELSLDELEDEDSSYIQESRLKRKLLRIFEKLCELKDCSSMTGRVIEQRILYRGTRYPEVNRRLEKFINSTRDLFPDYGDVIRVVERANEKHSLGLTRKQMQSMAQDAFRELGNKLQDRRHLDMIYNFGCHLTDPYKSVNDPAQQDSSLTRRLRENRNMALNRLDDVIKKYARLQDDGEEDTRRKTRQTCGKNTQSSSEGSEGERGEEEDVESEVSETDIEEELEHSKQRADSEEGENEEEEVPADQENEADQKMDMASDGEKEKEECEEATEQDSSPASSSTSHDKDSLNTTLESEVEAQLSGSSGLPSNGSPAKAKSDDEPNQEPEACKSPTHTEEGTAENQEDTDLVQSPEGKVSDDAVDLMLNCESSPDNTVNTVNHKSTEKYLLPDMTVSLMVKDKDDSEQDGEDVTEPADDPSREGSDADAYSEPPLSPVFQEESGTDVHTEEPCTSRRTSIDSEAASIEEETGCTNTSGNPDEEDGDSVLDSPDSRDQTPSDTPTREDAATPTREDGVTTAKKDEVTPTKVHTAATDLDDCENKMDCDLSPLRSSNGVHELTPVRKTSLNRLKLRKVNATLKDSCKALEQEEHSSPPRRKRKNMTPEKWTNSNGLNRFNGKERTEDHKEKSCKRIKIDHSSYTSLSSSSDCDSIIEDEDTPGLMMTCSSPVDTPTKPIRKCHISTQCDPDEVIVLSD